MSIITKILTKLCNLIKGTRIKFKIDIHDSKDVENKNLSYTYN